MMPGIISVVVIALTIISVVVGKKSRELYNPDDWLQIKRLFDGEEFAQCLRLLEAVNFSRWPNQVQQAAWSIKAQCNLALNRDREFELCRQTLLQKCPPKEAPLQDLYLSFRRAKRDCDDQAVTELLKQADERLKPKDRAKFYTNAAVYYFDDRRYELAFSCSDIAAGCDRGFYKLALTCLVRLGDYRRAKRYYEAHRSACKPHELESLGSQEAYARAKGVSMAALAQTAYGLVAESTVLCFVSDRAEEHPRPRQSAACFREDLFVRDPDDSALRLVVQLSLRELGKGTGWLQFYVREGIPFGPAAAENYRVVWSHELTAVDAAVKPGYLGLTFKRCRAGYSPDSPAFREKFAAAANMTFESANRFLPLEDYLDSRGTVGAQFRAGKFRELGDFDWRRYDRLLLRVAIEDAGYAFAVSSRDWEECRFDDVALVVCRN